MEQRGDMFQLRRAGCSLNKGESHSLAKSRLKLKTHPTHGRQLLRPGFFRITRRKGFQEPPALGQKPTAPRGARSKPARPPLPQQVRLGLRAQLSPPGPGHRQTRADGRQAGACRKLPVLISGFDEYSGEVSRDKQVLCGALSRLIGEHTTS